MVITTRARYLLSLTFLGMTMLLSASNIESKYTLRGDYEHESATNHQPS